MLRKLYCKAINANQKNIEAISISSYDKREDLVDSRFVNLKFIDNEDFIFFTNYNSPKSNQFNSHHQISAVIYWANIDCQIRIKAHIKKTTLKFNNNYF